jgi:cytochrome c oxidase cbb3-type subunit 3/ubiquinol-cytochrome c reductase cytochrome c subunit
MNARSLIYAMLAGALSVANVGCMKAPGKPGLATEARPEQVLDFPTLYKQNCAACHGNNGVGGAAISLANPAYLATAGVDNIRSIAANGVPGTLMPAFGKKAGGMLTDAQLGVISQGMIDAWGRASALGGATPLPYAAQGKGDAVHGQAAYGTFCASCHGADGTGTPGKIGSIVDPAYLALVDDQGLRSIVIAGRPDLGMPGAYPNGQGARAMTDQQVTDIVAWLASQRTASPGAPYPEHP